MIVDHFGYSAAFLAVGVGFLILGSWVRIRQGTPDRINPERVGGDPTCGTIIGITMPTAKVAVTIDRRVLSRLDDCVRRRIFPSRSRAVQEAVQEKLARLDRSRLVRECAKLDRVFERALAEEGLSQELTEWPEY